MARGPSGGRLNFPGRLPSSTSLIQDLAGSGSVMTAAPYPKSTKPTPPYESINPRPLPPIRPPPTDPRIPKLPAHIQNLRRDVLNILPGFVLSTHLFPASFPRTKCGPESIPNFSKEREKRMEEASVAAKGLLDLRRDQLPAIYEYTEEKEEPLWLSVNRFYRPGGFRVATGKKALTLWLLHANGFHKEVSCCYSLWIWSHIYARSQDVGRNIKIFCIRRPSGFLGGGNLDIRRGKHGG